MAICRICGRDRPWLDGHHVVPIGMENIWSKPWNRRRIFDRFGFGVDEEKAFICRGCHNVVQEWLRDPKNMLFLRVCDLCGAAILIGFDGDQPVSFELDGRRFHYESAEVQIEAFKKNSERV